MEQLDQLTMELAKGAEHHGFSDQVWTRPRINQVINQLFGVSYDPSQIGRLLKKVGWSRQKPARLARQQDTQAVLNWQEERLPALKKGSN
ncbi:helix-turn-helix domain-containing protein [Spirosoma pollinicola]|uniref:helix-turn-helix domain-containing protein n=1 Tax=Spirosoma pollinicola TaxID=2057025 RepID=UPI001F0C08CC|nr:winged helix-turn-helix domain-containing protein [Spirosoma pollinicola]